MVPLSNSRITSWLLLAVCARFSAHAHTGYRLDYDQSPISYHEISDGQPASKEDFPFNDQLTGDYNPYDRDDSVASAASVPPISAPQRPGSSRRDGWTPILRSQATGNERDNAKVPLRHEADGLKRERAGSPRRSRTTNRGYGRPQQLRHFQRPNDALKAERASAKPPPPKDDLRAAFRHPPKRKDAFVLSENDIMWMHYGPQIGNRHQQLRHQEVRNQEIRNQEVRNQEARNQEVRNQEIRNQEIRERSKHTAAVKIGQRSYEVEEPSEYGEDAEPPPRNIYQVIDRTSSTPPAKVAGPTKRQTTETGPVDEPSSESSVRTYKFGYEDRLVEPPAGGGESAADSQRLDDDDHLEGVGSAADFTRHPSNARNVGGFVNVAAASTAAFIDDGLNSVESMEPLENRITEDTSASSATSTKSGRLWDSPIVIVDPQTTTLTPEYYRQLFDSFSSGHYRQADVDSPPPSNGSALRAIEKPLPATAATTAATPLARVAASTDRAGTSVSKQSTRQTKKRDETEKSNSVFFTVPSHRLMDLLPETLRVNLIAVKRVLIDCYTPGDKNANKSSSVNCFKKITFDILDKAIESDVVRLTDAVSLVKDNKTTSGQGRSATSRSIDKTEWLPNIIERIQQLFSTHALKVKLMNSESDSYHVEGRRRYRHTFRRVFPVVASIYMIVTSVLMPLVFQFMAVMAGKSFTVGKIALLFALLTSFNKFLSIGIDNILPWYLQPNHASPSPPPPSPPLLPVPYPVPFGHYNHQKKDNRKQDNDVYGYSYTTKRVPVNYVYYTLE